MYGTAVWGWIRWNPTERMQSILGLVKSTPSYIRKIEANKRSIEVEAGRSLSARF